MKLTEYHYLPEGLLERPASSLYRQLDGPTLIHLPGLRQEPLFISVLQHGNEDTGWEAVRRLLKSHYSFDPLPRSVSLLIGNVEAARFNKRRLDNQPDYNRCWPQEKSGGHESEVHNTFRHVYDIMQAKNPFAAIDIHNNTGLNPHYAAINQLDNRFFRLAALFSNTVVYFTIPEGVLSNAFSNFCPAVTLECGLAGNIHGTDHTLAYLESCLHLPQLDNIPLPGEEMGLFHMVATVKVDANLDIGFGGNGHELSLIENLDHMNFRELETNTLFGYTRDKTTLPFITTDMHGKNVSGKFFSFEDGEIRTTHPIMPSMLTMDQKVIHQDCLCYLMERMDPQHSRAGHDEPLPEPTGLEGIDN
ncbi:MAG: succinylglutamate desuccinylase/aspartoacylase family protein [Proteobacteria bacterium]|nr:succinylglutamate desuccinylase/aspartoacylase family protein [Pseudomonadota bacterium]